MIAQTSEQPGLNLMLRVHSQETDGHCLDLRPPKIPFSLSDSIKVPLGELGFKISFELLLFGWGNAASLAVLLLKERGWLLLRLCMLSMVELNLCLHFTKLLNYKNCVGR